ncbi:flagellar hook-associated protein FlgL [Deefgea salmonis]|uniref:Flagellar hook-associated protein FlgL n=2 Tax=Deefgea TaxID=400947 RepID=A0ABS8BJ63_9NEIS|nr:flagellar hook-associated protein FlgL [Deefgea salmonis]MCB5195765.1 flagellar hook-associated protein FlgL [Deefgea salmonis]
MRIATTTIFSLGSNALQMHQNTQAKLQAQLSANRRVLTPADDPIASARILDLAQAQSINGQYATNSATADSFMRLSESTLQQVTSTIQNVQELAVRAGNPALAASEKKMLDAELQGRYQELLGLANTTDGQGNYLFSGFKGDIKPFTEAAFGQVTYQGDDGRRLVQISDGRQLPISEAGSDIFQKIKNGNGTFVTAYNAANTGSGIVGPGEVTDPNKWALAPAPRDFSIQFQVLPDPANITKNITTYDLVNTTTGVSLIDGATVPRAAGTAFPRTYAEGADIEFKQLATDPVAIPVVPAWDYGIKTHVKGAPAASATSNDRFSVKTSTNVDLFSTLGALSSALNTYQSGSTGAAVFQNQLNTALSDLSNSLGSVVTRQAYLGARMNETDSVKDTTEDMKLQYTTTLTALEGLDYAAAISDFAENQMVLDATRKSFAQVQDLSLFKYI